MAPARRYNTSLRPWRSDSRFVFTGTGEGAGRSTQSLLPPDLRAAVVRAQIPPVPADVGSEGLNRGCVRLDPDHHSGSFKWILVATLLLRTMAFSVLARSQWRRYRAVAVISDTTIVNVAQRSDSDPV
jgi:hypothetical protein